MGSNPTGGRSAGPALEGQLGPGLDSGGGGDLGLGLGDLGLGETPAPIQTQDVDGLRQRKRFSDFWSGLFGEGGQFGGQGFGGGGGGGFGGGGGSRGK
jgi:hypothetical protein